VAMGHVLESRRRLTKSSSISIEELGHALELTDNNDRTKEEKKIYEGIVSFGMKDVKQIMTPRTDVSAVAIHLEWRRMFDEVMESGFSRIPVYRESIDHIAGILYIKDLLPYVDHEAFDWTSLLRQPFFVPENKKIDDLLREFQGRKMHMAVVVDEYGGTSGIVTLEDVMEEIVGEITDEFDEDDIHFSKLDDYNYIFEGKTALIDLYRILNIDGTVFEAAKGDSDTLAGFVVEHAGKIPLKGERYAFEAYWLTVEASDRRRVKQVKVSLPQPDDKNNA
jgi:gliding motility-associated protein GldE